MDGAKNKSDRNVAKTEKEISNSAKSLCACRKNISQHFTKKREKSTANVHKLSKSSYYEATTQSANTTENDQCREMNCVTTSRKDTRSLVNYNDIIYESVDSYETDQNMKQKKNLFSSILDNQKSVMKKKKI